MSLRTCLQKRKRNFLRNISLQRGIRVLGTSTISSWSTTSRSKKPFRKSSPSGRVSAVVAMISPPDPRCGSRSPAACSSGRHLSVGGCPAPRKGPEDVRLRPPTLLVDAGSRRGWLHGLRRTSRVAEPTDYAIIPRTSTEHGMKRQRGVSSSVDALGLGFRCGSWASVLSKPGGRCSQG